ncbi:MAG: WG repeat-containing protein, partial [Bacteroidota bacterium]
DWGLIDISGKEIIAPYYQSMLDINDGLIPTKLDGKWGVLDLDENWVLEPQFKGMISFSEGLAGACNDQNQWGFIDRKGQVVIPYQWKNVKPFSQGAAIVKRSWTGSSVNMIDKKGKLLLEKDVRDLQLLKKSKLYSVRDDEKNAKALFDSKGKQISQWYKNFFYSKDGMLSVTGENYKRGVISISGKEIFPATNHSVHILEYGLLAIQETKESPWILYDYEGKKIRETDYDRFISFVNKDRGVVIKDDNTIIIDREGKQIDFYPFKTNEAYQKDGFLVFKGLSGYYLYNEQAAFIKQLHYDEVGGMNNGAAFVKEKGKLGIIDQDGTELIPLQYQQLTEYAEDRTAGYMEGAATPVLLGPNNELIGNIATYKYYGPFKDGLARVTTNAGAGFINPSGEIVFTVEGSNNIGEFSEDMAFFQDFSSQKFGFIDKSGNKVIPATWDQVGAFQDGYVIVLQGDKYGAIDKTGAIKIPVEYDDFTFFHQGFACFKAGTTWYLMDKAGHKTPLPGISKIKKPAQVWPIGAYDQTTQKWGFINQKGAWAIEPQFHEVGVFKDGFCWVSSKKDKSGVINLKGEVLVPMGYKGGQMLTDAFSIGAYMIKDTEHRGIFNHTNHALILPWTIESASSDGERIITKQKSFFFHTQLK